MKYARIIRFLILAGLWLAPICVALRLAFVWKQLPKPVAVHFTMSGSPDAFWLRQTFALFTVAIIFAAVGLGSLYFRASSSATGKFVIAVLTFVVLVQTGAIWAVINFNLGQTHIDWARVFLLPAAAAIVVFAVLGLISPSKPSANGRTAPAVIGTVLAVFYHYCRKHFWLLIPALLIPSLMWILGGTTGRIIALLLTGLLAVVLIGVWRGFEYRVTTSGVEVRSLGVRLKFLPASCIRSFSKVEVDPLAEMGGWGIRRGSGMTAYIWGKRGVKINSDLGQVLLGYSRPDDLLDVLTAMKQRAV